MEFGHTTAKSCCRYVDIRLFHVTVDMTQEEDFAV